MTADGTVLGKAPILVYENVRVRRVHRVRSNVMVIVGCAVDISGFFAAVWYRNHRDDEVLRATAAVIGLGMFEGCFNLALGKLAAVSAAPMMKAQGRQPLYPGAPRTDEYVMSRTIDLVARWDGLAETRAHISLPAQRAITLRLARRYTFDEALVLWARQSDPLATAENLYRVGNAYRHPRARGGAWCCESGDRPVHTLPRELCG